jgi:NAD(P)-dependent dehydrogenase (short-subunit alcohol dehydrogenase family)
MNVTVFGATGQIGRLVVGELLDAGHDVTPYVRNPDRLTTVDPRLVNVTGELSDGERIRQAIHGSDAVISALGPSLKRSAEGTPITDGTKHIVAAMEAENVGRFIGLPTPSVPDERDEPTLKAKVLPIIAGFLFANALADITGMTRAVKPKGSVRAGFLGRDKVGSAMSRADVAALLGAQLTDDTFSRAAPAISN